MDTIVAGSQGSAPYEGPAVDLPEVEPDTADLSAIEAALDDLVDEHLTALDVQVSTHGHADELATRRYRRAVRAALRGAETTGVAA